MHRDQAAELYQTYDGILRTLVGMNNHPEAWILPGKTKRFDNSAEE
jgi:hypothetical protein